MATLAAVVLVCFVTAELGLRLVHHLRPSFLFERDTQLRFRSRPHAPNYGGRLNSRGFNDREFSGRPAAGVYRIAALGDSFVFGVVPYRHNFLTLLEGRLAAAGRPVELLNLGIPGTGPEHHPRLLAEEVLALAPDAVILFVYLGNDLTESAPLPPGRWSSFTFELLRFLLRVLPRTELRVYHPDRVYHDDRPTFETAAYLEIVERNAAVFDPGWAELTPRHERLVSAIRRSARLCRGRGVELAVILLPAELQVSAELRRQLASASWSGRPLDLGLPNRALRRSLEEAGIAFLDLTPAFVAAGAERRLYKLNDSHWNIAGNRLAADLLEAWLTSGAAGLRPPEPRPISSR